MHLLCPPSCAGQRISPLPRLHMASSLKKHTQRSGILFHHCHSSFGDCLLWTWNVQSKCFGHHGTFSNKKAREGTDGSSASWPTIGMIPRSNCSTIDPEIQLLYCRNFKPVQKLWIVTPLKRNKSIPCRHSSHTYCTFPRSYNHVCKQQMIKKHQICSVHCQSP